jgi:hypothetical protein
MPYIGDDYLTAKQYKDLRAKYRAARPTQPWLTWAKYELSPAGERNRAAAERTHRYEARVQAANWAGVAAQRKAMDAQFDPLRGKRIAELTLAANERDLETGDYSTRALAAQKKLARMGA